jgi:hypothetical protein
LCREIEVSKKLTMVDSHKKVLKFCQHIRSQEASLNKDDRDRLLKPKVGDFIEKKDENEPQENQMEFI